MKIFKWVIYKKSRIDRILKLLQGNKDDILIASEFLRGKQKIKPPQYKITVDKDRAYLYFLNKSGIWEIQHSTPGDMRDPNKREEAIDFLKKKIDNNPPFESFEIFY